MKCHWRACCDAHAGEEEQDGPSEEDFSGDSVRLKPQAPPGATGEIARILNARDHFAVMDIPRESEGTEVKKAFRSKLVCGKAWRRSTYTHELVQAQNLSSILLSGLVCICFAMLCSASLSFTLQQGQQKGFKSTQTE